MWLGRGTPRDDKVLAPDDAQALLGGQVVVEEKLDGANVGFSLSQKGQLQVQNRGQYLERPFSGQFSRMNQWLAAHEEGLQGALGGNLIAFGEWCAARHSLDYVSLPDWWLNFDVYDRKEKIFWSSIRRNSWAKSVGVASTPCLDAGMSSIGRLQRMLSDSTSRYRPGSMEGLVIRKEDKVQLLARAKLVNATFTQSIETHWRRRELEWNRLAY